MAIFARPADTRPDLTLMGQVLLDPIKNRVEYGFFLKKPEAGLGFGKNLVRTRTRTRLGYILITKTPSYI